jgi:hypothetical protein
MLGNSSIAAQLVASQEGLSAMKLVIFVYVKSERLQSRIKMQNT